MRGLRLGRFGLLLVVLGAVVSCSTGTKMASVSGKVTYKGKPLKAGQIVFIDSKGKSAGAEIGADGRYEVKAAVGENAVMVESQGSAGAAVKSAEGYSKSMPGKSLIPERYQSPATSGLKYTVKAGDNTNVDFNLTD